MTRLRSLAAPALGALILLPGCVYKHEKTPLPRNVFTAAVTKCKPLGAKFTENNGAPPSVEITIPSGSSTVPECMAREFGDHAVKELKITYGGRGS